MHHIVQMYKLGAHPLGSRHAKQKARPTARAAKASGSVTVTVFRPVKAIHAMSRATPTATTSRATNHAKSVSRSLMSKILA